MSACCTERGCRRKQPMLIMLSELTQTWYIVTKCKLVEESGVYFAQEKHRLPDEAQRMLNTLHAAHNRPRSGDRVENGGVMGTLIRCPECSGDGLLHKEDPRPLHVVLPQPLDG